MLPSNWKDRFKNITAYGTILKISPATFLEILSNIPQALVLKATGTGIFRKKISYLTTYKGIGFATSTDAPLHLPQDVEILKIDKILISRWQYTQRL